MSGRAMNVGELIRSANRLKREGKLDEAIALYHQIIEINPNFAWAYNNLGDALAKQRKFSDAISLFDHAIQISPIASYYYSLGKIFVEQDDLDKAINRFQQAIEIQPNFNLAKQALEKSRNRQKQSDRFWKLKFHSLDLKNLSPPFTFEGDWEVRECSEGIYGLFSRQVNSKIRIPVEGSKVVLVFHRHPWSGMVQVSVGGYSCTIDLYSETPEYDYRVEIDTKFGEPNLLEITILEENNSDSSDTECWLFSLSLNRLPSWNNLLQENLALKEQFNIDTNLAKHGRKVYSQNDEDGIIDKIFHTIGTTNKFFVEFGVGPPWGKSIEESGLETNTRLLKERGWQGVLIDGKDYPADYEVVSAYITALNVNNIFSANNVPSHFDLLSIDIDGQDFWVWNSLTYKPRVVIIEYNSTLPIDSSCVIPLDIAYVWDGTNYFGASLLALQKLGKTKGYVLVYSNGVNAFFIEESLVHNKHKFTLEKVYTYKERHEPDSYNRPWINV